MSAQELIPATLPLRGTRLIEASAGTGKTWTIAALYTRLVLGHRDADTDFSEPLTPDQILVVTYTDAATAELRDRIRKRLAEAAEVLGEESGQCKDAFLKELTNNLSSNQRQDLIHRLTIAADAMDDAAIYTIHGWCSRMLRQHAFDSGAPFELKIEGEEIELLNESVRDFWRSFFYPLSAEECQLIEKVARSPEDLLKKIRSLLKESDHSLASLDAATATDPADFKAKLSGVLAIEKSCRDAEQKAQTLWHAHRISIEEIIRKAFAAGHLNGGSYKDLDGRLNAFNLWAQGLGQIKDSKWVKGFSKGEFKLNKAAQLIEPEHPVFDLLAKWMQHETALEAAIEALNNLIVLTALHWIRKDFANAKSLKGRLDYNDLILQLHENLVKGENLTLAHLIRTQYPVALIDEFQDTDPEQYEIFETVYGRENPESAWLMVGDPKQAIYGFRGADVYAYLRARNQGAMGHGSEAPPPNLPSIYTLPCNHRSTSELVKATNQLFLQAESTLDNGAFNFPKSLGSQDRIDFSAVRAKGREEKLIIDGQLAHAMTFWYESNDDKALGQTLYRKQMADHCANEIVTLLNKSGKDAPEVYFEESSGKKIRVRASDIAILVRDGKEATAIRNALSQRGLKSVYLSDRDSVFQSREAKDLLIWLKACLNPESSRLIRAAMATKTMSLTYAELDALNGDEYALDQRIAEFTHYGHHWRAHGILPAVRQIILDQNLPERHMTQVSGERTLTNLLHLAELLQAESELRDGEHGILRFLQESIDDEDQDAKDNVLRLESDQSLIRVVTIHKSKGLEYPLVFLPFVCGYKETRLQNLTAYRYHLEDDPKHPLKLELTKGCQDGTLPKSYMERERLQEELRLLYVAITRARHACWLGMAPLKIGQSAAPTLYKGAMGYLLGLKEGASASEVRSRLVWCMGETFSVQIIDIVKAEPILFMPGVEDGEQFKADVLFEGKPFDPWWIASYSALKYAKVSLELQKETGSRDDPETARDDQSGEEEETAERLNAPNTPDGSSHAEGIHAFPAGAKHGVFLHDLLEAAAKIGFDVLSKDPNQRDRLIERVAKGQVYANWLEVLKSWLPGLLNLEFKGSHQTISLAALSAEDCLTEMEFWFEANDVKASALDRIIKTATLKNLERPPLQPNTLNGVLKGFIDLVFRHEGKYYVADYKSNRLGGASDAYTQGAIEEALLQKRYDVQYVLYLLALHRYLKSRLGEDYDYDRDVGGAVYFFLRGVEGPVGGVHFDKPTRETMEALDRLFQNAEKKEKHDAGE